MTPRNSDSRKAATGELAARGAAALRQIVGVSRDEATRRDSLTGLFDGRALHEALATAVADAEQRGDDVGLLFLDLDHFKRINDRHGHQAGSRILRQVATLFQTAASDAGGFAARYGGDEFVLVLPGTDIDHAVGRAELLRAGVASTLFPGGADAVSRPVVSLTCSIGAASLLRLPAARADSGESAAARLLRRADDAMYSAKRAGRNRVTALDARAAGVA